MMSPETHKMMMDRAMENCLSRLTSNAEKVNDFLNEIKSDLHFFQEPTASKSIDSISQLFDVIMSDALNQ